MKRKTGLKGKVFMLGAVIIFAVLIALLYIAFNIQQITFKEKKIALQNLVETVSATLAYYDAASKNGDMTREEAQKKAMLLIKNSRYAGGDYFWVHDLSPKMIVHPEKPELDGTDISTYTDARGLPLFAEMVKVCREQGEGFVQYWWQRPGRDAAQKKISYVKLFKPWDWVVGTGIYMDDLFEEISVIRTTLKVFIALLSAGILLLFLWFVRSVSRPVNSATEGLSQVGRQLISAAGQVTAASQLLAQASSEQAASLEETSSSLEEMSSMTRQNADNALQADNLMKEVNQVVTQAHATMTAMTVSMEEISKSSTDTSKIIKTIDEIAFQTNLLALNAAVEAARAGEAGAGFAVVADEVRSLAMRAAEAAKSTSGLIESTIGKVHDGSELMRRTNEAFTNVSRKASHAAQLVTEIAAASKEQSEGIEQINNVVAQMDKVIQQNAANAEESASSAEELKAQSEYIKKFIDDLHAVVSGTGDTDALPAEDLSSGGRIRTHKKKSLQEPDDASSPDMRAIDDKTFKDF